MGAARLRFGLLVDRSWEWFWAGHVAGARRDDVH